MISSENNHTIGSPGDVSNCEGSISPSSLRDSHSHASANEQNYILQHSLRDDNASSSPSSLANISANIEIHPQNDALGGSATHKFIKRPLNAYMIWTRQERKRILTEDPKMKMNEVSKAMGEKWKKMSDKEKKPYFELAKKYSEEHKMALQEHPELQYAPSKKKVVKKPDGKQQQSLADSSSVKSCTITPDASRSTTPRGASNLIAPQPISQSPMFSPFQTPLTPSTVQLAHQVLQGVRSVTSQSAIANSAMQNSILGAAPSFPQAFLQPQTFPQRVTNPSLLGGLSQPGSATTSAATARTTPGQMLDLYYTSLCQPAFPNITENPVNPLGMYPPHLLLDQYNQLQQQQQGNGGASGANSNASGRSQF